MTAETRARENVPNTRIERYGFIADIIINKHAPGDIFHYIIQRQGSAEILHWGQERSFENAMECVEEFLADRRQKQR